MVETEAYDCKSQYLSRTGRLKDWPFSSVTPSQVRDEAKSQGLPVKDGESLPRCGENPQTTAATGTNAAITEKRPQMSNKVSLGGVKGGGHEWYKSQHVCLWTVRARQASGRHRSAGQRMVSPRACSSHTQNNYQFILRWEDSHRESMDVLPIIHYSPFTVKWTHDATDKAVGSSCL